MHRARWTLAFLFILALFYFPMPSVLAADASSSSGSLEDRVNALTKVQPGLGTVMTEYGNRFVDVYFAAHGGNWGLAQYQLHEMLEIQEVGEITRPQYAPSLKAFEDAYLNPLQAKIIQKDLNAFNPLYENAVEGCNGCHAATGHSFIHFKLPPSPVEDYIDFSFKSNPSSPTDED